MARRFGSPNSTHPPRPAVRARRVRTGFTLLETMLALTIVLVGVLSAVVVVGVGGLTSSGSTAACEASLDAARAAATVHLTTTGAQPATFTAMVSSFDRGKKLVTLIESKVKGSKPALLCTDRSPPDVVRELKIDLKTGAVVK